MLLLNKDERVLARLEMYERSGHIGTVSDIDVDGGNVTVVFDEDKSTHVLKVNQLIKIREELRTDPNSANGQLQCKNCGWLGGAHVWFAPHHCKEVVTRSTLFGSEQPVPPNSVFEADVVVPIPIPLRLK